MSNLKNPEAETMSTILFLHLSSLVVSIHNLFQIIINKQIILSPPL